MKAVSTSISFNVIHKITTRGIEKSRELSKLIDFEKVKKTNKWKNMKKNERKKYADDKTNKPKTTSHWGNINRDFGDLDIYKDTLPKLYGDVDTKKGGEVDPAKVRKLPQFKKLSEGEKRSLTSGKGWMSRAKKKFPDADIFRNPPILRNPNNDAEFYIEDFENTMRPKEAGRKFKNKAKLKGKIGSKELFNQLLAIVQEFGEASGWIKGDTLYWRPGNKKLNEAMVSGYIMDDAKAYFHTHPYAWEPSQTSPDDFKVYHGLFTVNGVQDHFTVFGDRVDWFHFNKADRMDKDEMAEIITDFEDDIDKLFDEAEQEHLAKTDGYAHLRDRTKSIVDKFNKKIPEFQVRFRCYHPTVENIRRSE